MTESAALPPALPLATDQHADAAELQELDALEGLSEPAQDFLGALAAVGGSSGNGRLLGLLGWDAVVGCSSAALTRCRLLTIDARDSSTPSTCCCSA